MIKVMLSKIHVIYLSASKLTAFVYVSFEFRHFITLVQKVEKMTWSTSCFLNEYGLTMLPYECKKQHSNRVDKVILYNTEKVYLKTLWQQL